jgi:transcriptional regulator with XRE-family HTH domain
VQDYRDKLRTLLDELHAKDGITRYRIAKQSGISEQTLSNVMHKRRNLSLDALQKLLTSIGYELDFKVASGGPLLTEEVAVSEPDLMAKVP